MVLSIFSCTFDQNKCLLWRNVYLDLPPTFVVHFLDIERDTHELLVYFEDGMYVKTAHPKFSYSKCIVFSLTFRSLNHFEFIYLFISLYAVRECSDFILLHVAIQFFFSTTD